MAVSAHSRNDFGPRYLSRDPAPPHPAKRRRTIPLTSKESLVEFIRDRSNVRPYVRSSTQKLKWTAELHEDFLRAVKKLGGKDKATPKRILQLMKRDGITIAHIKSHLQMYRTGKIDPTSMPNTVILSVDSPPKLPSKLTNFRELSGEQLENFMKEAHEVHMALELLKEGRISGAAGAETIQKGFADIQAFKWPPAIPEDQKVKLPEDTKTTVDFVPVVELNEVYRPVPRLESFIHETAAKEEVDVTDSLSPRKRKAEEEIELDLTMATRPKSPKIQFPGPSTPEEATLSLGLA